VCVDDGDDCARVCVDDGDGRGEALVGEAGGSVTMTCTAEETMPAPAEATADAAS
jgi:hypothetical protein